MLIVLFVYNNDVYAYFKILFIKTDHSLFSCVVT